MAAEVSIRPFRHEDVPALYESVRESIDDLIAWMPWCHPDYSMAEARDWVEKQIAAFQARDEFHFAIVTGDEKLAGVCGLNGINRDNRLANLGYWVRSSRVGRGIATQATRLVAEWAFLNTDLNRLEILVAVRNHPSLRVAARSGAMWEGVLRGRLQLRSEMHDAVMFSIVRSDR